MKIKIIDFGLLPANTPRRGHDNDAGLDVCSPLERTLFPGETLKIPLGFGVEIPDGYVGFIFPRSSLSAKGIVCQLTPIDSGYRGEIHAVVTNLGRDSYHISSGDRIGQLVIMPVVIAELVNAKDERGTGAFGSTGK